ncbi:hypothetical protein [Pseudoalteromonas sp. T1lg88]|uniref:hypothetical protein n=1 Tax=Pseudoalteromonas sp. T1lg88 TaxID=2077104 RepID=UPI000CF734BE|nr:hypothetical protein [Pseudoalteromonas sp. T1lg88]
MYEEGLDYIGVVDWFGGTNKKTGKNNPFGFIDTPVKNGIFVHKQAVKHGLLSEGDIVVLNITTDKQKRARAKNVVLLTDSPEEFFERALPLFDSVQASSNLLTSFGEMLTEVFSFEQSLSLAKSLAMQDITLAKLLKVISKSQLHEQHFLNVMKQRTLDDLENCNCSVHDIPDSYISQNYEYIFQWWQRHSSKYKRTAFAHRAIEYLQESSHIASAIFSTLDYDDFCSILSKVQEVCGEMPELARLLISAQVPDNVVVHYLKLLDLSDQLNNLISSRLLPTPVIDKFLLEKIEANNLRISSEAWVAKLIVEHGLVRKALEAAGKEEQLLIAATLGQFSPFNINTLLTISQQTSGWELLEKYTNNYSLQTCLEGMRYVVPDHKCKRDLPQHCLKKLRDVNLTPSEVHTTLPLLTLTDENTKQQFYEKNIHCVILYLDEVCAEEERDVLLELLLPILDISAILTLIFKNILQRKHIEKRLSEVSDFVSDVIEKRPVKTLPYLRDIYTECFTNSSSFYQHPVIKPLYIAHQKEKVKAKIYNRDMSFIQDITSDALLNRDNECWFLSQLIPLLNGHNSPETISKVLNSRLWNGLVGQHFDIEDKSLYNLFPQCETLAHYFPNIRLSCEAFIWTPPIKDNEEPESIFLCRSKKCKDPQVIPNLAKHYSEYSVFDWLALYGISQNAESGPCKQDFAIKLAGFINRLKELYSRLNCRSCGYLMIPDLDYARTELTTIDPSTGHVVTMPVNAAYRVTVFRCNTPNCPEHNKGYYINHCLGHKCHNLIDSRDLSESCEFGRYKCNECGSCCKRHAQHTSDIHYDNLNSKYTAMYGNSPFYQVKSNK